MGQKLFIGGISFQTTSEGLGEFFDQSGTVLSANVITDQFSGQSRGFGFVEMATSEEAEKAVAQLNGRELDGRTLRVEVSRPKAAGAGRSGGFSDRRR
jgi:RNA recognition motif-containing protein